MTFTDDEIEKIKELAGLFFTYEEIAVLMKKDKGAFIKACRSENTAAYGAYMFGKTDAEYKIRKKTQERALKGSPAAEEIMLKHITTQKIREAK